jgi:hypothetical protein
VHQVVSSNLAHCLMETGLGILLVGITEHYDRRLNPETQFFRPISPQSAASYGGHAGLEPRGHHSIGQGHLGQADIQTTMIYRHQQDRIVNATEQYIPKFFRSHCACGRTYKQGRRAPAAHFFLRDIPPLGSQLNCLLKWWTWR